LPEVYTGASADTFAATIIGGAQFQAASIGSKEGKSGDTLSHCERFAAMESAGTPCPFAGKIGDEAKKLWATYPMLRPDYETYLERKEVVTEVNEKIKEQKEKEEAELAKKEAEERAAEALRLERELLTLKEKNEVENIEPIADSPVINVHE